MDSFDEEPREPEPVTTTDRMRPAVPETQDSTHSDARQRRTTDTAMSPPPPSAAITSSVNARIAQHPVASVALASTLAGVVVWGVDAAIDRLFFFDRSYWDLLLLDVPGHALWLRVLILASFTGFGVVVASVTRRLFLLAQHLDHLNRVLAAIRKVNRLIALEKDQDRLLTETCRTLVETRGYLNASLAIVGPDGRIEAFYKAGFEGAVAPEVERLRTAPCSRCPLTSLNIGGVVRVFNPRIDCPECPIAREYCGDAAFSFRLERGGQVFGWLSVSIPEAARADSEEQALFAELGRDIGHALWTIDLEARRQSAQRDCDAVLATTSDAVAALNADGLITLVNPGAEHLFAGPAETALGRRLASFVAAARRGEANAAIRHVITHGSPRTLQTLVVGPGGREVPVEINLGPRRDEGGGILGVSAILRDITERLEREHEYSQILTTAIDGFLVIDTRGALLDANPAAARMLGYTREELLCRSLFDIEAVESAAETRAHIRQLRESGSGRFETRQRRKDGSVLDVEVSASFLPFGQERFVAFIRDITDRKRSEGALLESEARFRTMFTRHSAIMLLIKPSSGHIVDANEAAERFYGHSHDSLVTMSIQDISALSPEEVAEHRRRAQLNRCNRFVFPHRLSSGEVRTVEVHSTPISVRGEQLLFSVIHDVTERERALEELKRSETLLSEAQRVAEIGSWELEAASGRVTCSDSTFRILGLEPAEITPTFEEFLNLVHPDDRDAVSAAFSKSLEAGAKGETIEHRAVRPGSGEVRHVRERFQHLRDDAGNLIRTVGVVKDVTDTLLAERERDLLMMAIEQAAEGVIITDTQGAIRYVNPAFERVTGYARSEVLGENPRFLKSGEHDAGHYRAMWDTLHRGKTWRGRFVNRRKDGTLLTEDTVISPVRDTTGTTVSYVAVKRDVTDEIKLEAQLLQAQKMEAVGRLAGGIAHDFNNMLGVILGNTEIALTSMAADDPAHESLREIESAATRSADLTRQLLAFARRQTATPEVLDLNATIARTLKMLRRLIGEDIALSWQPGNELWPVKIDPSQVDQVLANLCVNARDAIEGVGRIAIQTTNTKLSPGEIRPLECVPPGDYVQLTVSDTGCGMDAETMARVFEPFFTTKKAGDGTGLGLATVYGIVHQNHGLVDVISKPESGSTFRILLPRHGGRIGLQPRGGVLHPDRRGNETILLVEDESAMLRLCSRSLDELGYHVIHAGSPGEALALAERHEGQIQLLLTDVVMPEMNGRDLAAHLAELYPDIKRLYMSGYSADVVARQGIVSKDVHLLQKPFSRHELAAGVRHVLEHD